MAVLSLTGKPVLIRSSEKATLMAVIHSLDSVALILVLGQDANSGQNAAGGTNQPRETFSQIRTYC